MMLLMPLESGNIERLMMVAIPRLLTATTSGL
jgi:hypothetical protein